MKTTLRILLLSILLAVTSGCSVVEQQDGSKSFVFGLTDKQHEEIGKAGEAATNILGLLSSFYAPLGAAAVAAGGATAVWKGKKMKKAVVKNREPLKVLVGALESIKSDGMEPDTWRRVKEQIAQQYPTMEVEATIKEIKAEMYGHS
jgi:hypothetical protein